MRALVVGGDGKIGRALCNRLGVRGHDVNFTSRSVGKHDYHYYPDDRIVKMEVLPLDLRDPAWPMSYEPRAVGASKIVYLIAAITGIMRCETDPDAWRVNAEAPVFLARQATSRGWHVVFISSGTVERAPSTASARQKSYADLAVLLLGGCVVRPLPAVPPEKYEEFADLLVQVGEERRAGLVRWEG